MKYMKLINRKRRGKSAPTIIYALGKLNDNELTKGKARKFSEVIATGHTADF